MKKIFVAFFMVFISASLSFAGQSRLERTVFQESSRLPEIEGWINGETRIKKLDALSGNKGKWIERDYRTKYGTHCHAVWLDGAGPKGWEIKKLERENKDGAFGMGASFEAVTIRNFTAYFETHPLTGKALSIKFNDGVMTLESKLATKEELIAIAETIIDEIKTKN